MNIGTWEPPEKVEYGNVTFQEVETSKFKKINVFFTFMNTEAHSHYLTLCFSWLLPEWLSLYFIICISSFRTIKLPAVNILWPCFWVSWHWKSLHCCRVTCFDGDQKVFLVLTSSVSSSLMVPCPPVSLALFSFLFSLPIGAAPRPEFQLCILINLKYVY